MDISKVCVSHTVSLLIQLTEIRFAVDMCFVHFANYHFDQFVFYLTRLSVAQIL
jgi:hypothetical protein